MVLDMRVLRLAEMLDARDAGDAALEDIMDGVSP